MLSNLPKGRCASSYSCQKSSEVPDASQRSAYKANRMGRNTIHFARLGSPLLANVLALSLPDDSLERREVPLLSVRALGQVAVVGGRRAF